jgi:hypothetical protein
MNESRSNSGKVSFMSGYKPITKPEFPAANIIRSFAELVDDRQKLHDFLVTLSIEELRILADCTERISTEAGAWLY